MQQFLVVVGKFFQYLLIFSASPVSIFWRCCHTSRCVLLCCSGCQFSRTFRADMDSGASSQENPASRWRCTSATTTWTASRMPWQSCATRVEGRALSRASPPSLRAVQISACLMRRRLLRIYLHREPSSAVPVDSLLKQFTAAFGDLLEM